MSTSKSRDPFEQLGLEHAELGRVYRLLEGLLDRVETDGEPLRPELSLVVDYLNLFGDLRHHDKEESLLVPVLIQSGFDWYDGPLARMRREHRQERYLLRVLYELAHQDGSWSKENRRRLIGVGREFVAFMRAHTELENEQILAPARARVPAEARARLLDEFDRFDAEHADATDYAAVRKRIEPLLAGVE